MSINNIEIICQWDPCGDTAIKHVHFGLRRIGDVEAPTGPALAGSLNHLDLCSKHLYETRLNYHHFSEFELGGCDR